MYYVCILITKLERKNGFQIVSISKKLDNTFIEKPACKWTLAGQGWAAGGRVRVAGYTALGGVRTGHFCLLVSVLPLETSTFSWSV